MKLTARDIAAAEAIRQEVYHRFRSLFERYDALLMPAAPVKPFAVERQFPEAINGRTFESYIDWIAPAFLITLVGLPAASAPAGLTRDGLPVGMQIVAPRFAEPLILRIAALVHAPRRGGMAALTDPIDRTALDRLRSGRVPCRL